MQDTAGEARTNSSVMYSYGPPHIAKQKQDDQLEHTYSSYVRIRDVALKTCQKRWMIGRSGERGSGISVLAARHDDDDDDDDDDDIFKPENVFKNETYNILDVELQTDHPVPARMPDVMLTRRKGLLIKRILLF